VDAICKLYGVCVVGIANSVELFKGEIKGEKVKTHVSKIIFDPYTKEDMRRILFYLIKHHYEIKWKLKLEPFFSLSEEESNLPGGELRLLLKLFDLKALDLCASRIDKLSGDLRGCFQIMRNSVSEKLNKLQEMKGKPENLDSLLSVVKLTLSDVNEACDKMFESHIIRLIRKLPPAFRFVLLCI
jgi:Cdc6-like AAA superfamily ATPase